MKWIRVFAPKTPDNMEIIKFNMKIKANIPRVLKNFLLNVFFKEIKNAIKGFLFLKNRQGMYKNVIK